MSALPIPFGPDLKVVVLAGSNPISAHRRRVREQRRRRGEPEIPLENKAFLKLRGQLVIEYVLDWLHEAGLHRIWVLAEEHGLHRIPPRHRFTPIPQLPGATVFVNLSAAYAQLQPPWKGGPVTARFA